MEFLDLILHCVLFVLWIINIECTGMLKPDPNADLNADATKINEAFGAWNTGESTFLEILPRRGCQQRSEIYQKLDQEKRQNKRQYNFLSGDVYLAVMTCFFCGPDYYAMWIKQAVEDWDTDTLIEMLVLLSFDDVKSKVLSSEAFVEVEDASTTVKKDIRELLRLNVNGDFGNWVNEMIMRTRDTNTDTDPEKAKTDAKALIKEIEDEGLDDKRQKLDEILAERSMEQIRLTLDEFKKENDDTELAAVIEDQLDDDDLEKAYLSLIMYIREGRTNYFAIRLNEVMDGVGTDDKNLSRLIIYLAESELVEVDKAFQEKYEISIAERIKDETSGFQEEFLLAFMGMSPD